MARTPGARYSRGTFDSLLGVFLLGLLTTRHANRANVVAMVVMALARLLGPWLDQDSRNG